MRQSVIRKSLGTAPVPESEEHLTEMYKVYSLFSHVNRQTVFYRLLGEGIRLTLGGQGNVDEKVVGANLRELLSQMVWFVDVFNFIFAKLGILLSKDYGQQMLAYRGEVAPLVKELPALF